MPNTTSLGASRIALLVAAAASLWCPAPLSAQQPPRRPATAAPQYQGIWEAVNYSEDVEFTDVFFVTGEIGWAVGLSRSDAGEGGFILHTKDGGQTWELQFGDPHSATRGLWQLDFIDERHGWATWFGGTLLRTTDGENWEPMGDFRPGNPFAFVSPTVGFYVSGTQIHRTTDAGRTWKPQFDCRTRVEVDGLAREVTCPLEAIHFASPDVGYAASRELENGASVVVKTEDGGTTWRVLSTLGDGTRSRAIHFSDEKNGLIRGYYKLHATADGGVTWREVAATIPVVGALGFADAEVGWSIHATTVSSTTDGGRRWTARETAFPTPVVAFSAPRRDRAYVVGTHGMVYRYRAIPIAEAMPPRSLPAPLMPGFGSPLDGQVAALDTLVDAIEADIARMPDAGTDAPPTPPPGSAGADSAVADSSVEGGALPPASGFTTACCAKRLNRLYLIISSVAQSLPQFLSKNKNNNLLLAGLRMITDLPQQFGAIKAGLRAFRQAGDKESAKQALAQVSAAADALHQSAAVAFQKELPPAGVP